MNIKKLVVVLALALFTSTAAGCEEVAIDPWRTNLVPGLCEEVLWCLCREPTGHNRVPLCYDQDCNVCYSKPEETGWDWVPSQYSDEPVSCEAEMDWDRWRECRSVDYRPGM